MQDVVTIPTDWFLVGLALAVLLVVFLSLCLCAEDDRLDRERRGRLRAERELRQLKAMIERDPGLWLDGFLGAAEDPDAARGD